MEEKPGEEAGWAKESGVHKNRKDFSGPTWFTTDELVIEKERDLRQN